MRGDTTPLSRSDMARLGEVRAELRALDLTRPRVHVDFTREVRDLLKTSVVSAYGLEQAADD